MNRLVWAIRLATLTCLCAGTYFAVAPGYELRSVVQADQLPKGFIFSEFFPPTIIDSDALHFQASGLIPMKNEVGSADGRGIFLIDGGKLISMFEPPAYSYAIDHNYGVRGDTAYYLLDFGGRIVSYQNGKLTTVLSSEEKAPNGLRFERVDNFDVDGDVLAFSSPSSTVREGGIFALKSGKISSVMGKAAPLKTHEIKKLLIDGDRVFVQTDFGLFSGTNDDMSKFVLRGDPVPGGVLTIIRSFSADRGLVALSAVVTQGTERHEAVYTVANGAVQLIAQAKPRGEFGAFKPDLATNGKAVAYVSFTGGKVDLGKLVSGSPPNHRLVVHEGQIERTVVETGQEVFGGVVTGIAIGPRAIDSERNIAFSYGIYTKNGGQRYGIAIGQPNAPLNSFSLSLFGIALCGAVFELARHIKSSYAASSTLASTQVVSGLSVLSNFGTSSHDAAPAVR